ncbi:MAG: Gfo/Idh/MocA family oxidoreductase [Thermomicrobiales bacterium]|nr:Gfo/Idh/MocA family oxidoreductase [Thermomicrobiales bacterium]MCO5218149.1 Gfo/Idh/MocA family oxidoreductase [Thermomicrobiales bacterium]MCO5224871.1 Gfo/Idh/MocA family oxidoreductase [Thermomicrobiales bacterium]MCO5228951.1 Gfo/Idh/MocA family oxidoreductase [Thermomicrobiales bacterium]
MDFFAGQPTTKPGEFANRPVRLALIGTGFGSQVHLPAIAHIDHTELVAICSRRQDRVDVIAARHGIPSASTDWRDVVNDAGIDAVIVATPPYLHHQMVIAALEAGKHVLCEKPLARNLAEARDMVRLAERAGVVAMVDHQYRYLPIRRRVKELIDEGYIGTPHAINMIVFNSELADPEETRFNWLMEEDKAGGMLRAIGSHYVDTMRWWLGEIDAVSGTMGTMVNKRRMPDSTLTATVDADDNFAFILQFRNGAIGTVHFSSTAPVDAGDSTTITGSDGMLIVEADSELFGARKRDVHLRELAIPDRLNPKLPEFSHPLTRPTILLMRDWISAIREGDLTRFAPSFADGEKVQEIIDGVIRSREQGRWIDTSGAKWPRTSRI